VTAPATLPLTDDWQAVPDGCDVGEAGGEYNMSLGGKTYVLRHRDGRSITDNPPGWAELLELLTRGGEFDYWWFASQTKDEKGQAREKLTTWWPKSHPSDLPGDSGPHGSRNLYFGVHPVGSIPQRISKKSGKPIPQQFVRAALADVCAVNCVFAEFDIKDFDDQHDKVLASVEGLPLRPTVAIYSGGGIHCYWVFDKPITISTTEHRKRAKAIQAAWVKLVGSDDGSKDLARVLRVPGTFNHKYSPPRPVSFAWCELERLYTFDQIAALLPKPSPHGHTPRSTASNELDDQKLIDKAMGAKNGAAFAQLWRGEFQYYASHSQADMALCSVLAFWTGADAGRMDRLFRASGLMREKWDNHTTATAPRTVR
jgi:hypothetical protein